MNFLYFYILKTFTKCNYSLFNTLNMNPRWDNSLGLIKDDPKNNMIIIRQSYNILL